MKEENPKFILDGKEFLKIADTLKFLEKKLFSKQRYRQVMELDEEKEVYIGVDIELITKEQFEKEYIAND